MLDLNDIIVIDDAISPQFQDMIENWLTAPASSWSFARDIALADNVIEKLQLNTRPGFSKTLFNVKCLKRHIKQISMLVLCCFLEVS
jgi:hypothetical protein